MGRAREEDSPGGGNPDAREACDVPSFAVRAADKRARGLGRRQVLSGPFPSILHRKIRKYVKDSRIFLSCLNEKFLAQNCHARKKKDSCVGRGEKRRNTGHVFRAFSTKLGAKRFFLRCRIPILRALMVRAVFLFFSDIIPAGPDSRGRRGCS